MAAFLVLAGMGAAGPSGPAAANQGAFMAADGKPLIADEHSIKCEAGEIPNISTKRLAHCDSARVVEVTHDGVTEQAIKFTIRPFDKRISDGIRAELRDLHEAVNGEETWYRLSTLLPRDFAIDSPHRLVLAQWHERVRDGMDSLRPPLSHRLWNGRFVVTLWNAERIEKNGIEGDGEILFDMPALERGVFYEHVYRIRWSASDDGAIDGWLRTCAPRPGPCASEWKKILTYRGATGYPDDQVAGYYFKFGLYTVTDFEVPFVAYHKGYKSGATAADVDADDPVFSER
ncbi:MAG: heparin lyase I family protein [Pseudomonadota bacterium]